jgi:hypothetical protein
LSAGALAKVDAMAFQWLEKSHFKLSNIDKKPVFFPQFRREKGGTS